MSRNIHNFEKYYKLCLKHKNLIEKLLAQKITHYIFYSAKQLFKDFVNEQDHQIISEIKNKYKISQNSFIEIMILGGMMEAILQDPKIIDEINKNKR